LTSPTPQLCAPPTQPSSPPRPRRARSLDGQETLKVLFQKELALAVRKRAEKQAQHQHPQNQQQQQHGWTSPRIRTTNTSLRRIIGSPRQRRAAWSRSRRNSYPQLHSRLPSWPALPAKAGRIVAIQSQLTRLLSPTYPLMWIQACLSYSYQSSSWSSYWS